MKCKVRLTRTVELFVEGKDEEVILDWLYTNTPASAYRAADGSIERDAYDEEIICVLDDSWEVDYVIKEEE